MSQCTDIRFEKYLHAYELGMLSDEERAAFEIHQLECGYCFEAVTEFAKTAHLIRFDEGVDQELDRLERTTPAEEREKSAFASALSLPKSWRRPAYLRVAALVAAIVVVLVLKPWRLEFESTQEIQAQGYRVAVMRFNNLSGAPETQWLGSAVAGLLISDLAQSDHLQIVSGERLANILRHFGKETTDPVDFDIAKRVAVEANASWALFGDIIQDKSEIALVSHLVDMTSGDVVASQRVEGRAEESLFALVDSLTVAVKNDLALPAAAQDDEDLPVADVTTHSTEAYSHYLDGLDYVSRLYIQQAVRSFEMAIELDSTFAMAYYHLSRSVPSGRGRELIRKALLHSEGINQRDRLLIECSAAWREGDRERAIALAEGLEVLYPNDRFVPLILGRYLDQSGDPHRAIRSYIRATRIDPLYKEAWNLLAYAYQSVGNTEMAIEIVDRYISIAPDEANPYDTKGEICVAAGRIDQAIEAFQQAREADPDFGPAAMSLATLYLYRGEYEAAESQFADLVAMDSGRTVGFEPYTRALLLTYQGRFREAMEVLGETVPTELSLSLLPRRRQNPALLKARIHWTRNEFQQAVDLFRSAIESDAWPRSPIPISIVGEYALLLAESGDLDQAYRVVDSLSKELPDRIQPELYEAITEGALSFAEDDLFGARRHFGRAVELTSGRFARFMLGRAYLESGRAGRAADVIEELAGEHSLARYLWDVWDARVDFYLAVAYDQSGRYEEAIGAYRRFLSKHALADDGLEQVEEARSRLTQLLENP